MAAKFGPAGTCDLFKEKGYKHSLQIPEFLTEIGLDHFEYQCGRGVNIGKEKAKKKQVQQLELLIRCVLTYLFSPFYNFKFFMFC